MQLPMSVTDHWYSILGLDRIYLVKRAQSWTGSSLKQCRVEEDCIRLNLLVLDEIKKDNKTLLAFT